MNWTDLLEIATDFLRYGGAVVFLIAIAVLVVLAAAMTATPEHRSRYERMQDEAGDTHTTWDLHRADIPTRPLATPTPRPRVRAISSVRTARDAQLRPSFDSRAHRTEPRGHRHG